MSWQIDGELWKQCQTSFSWAPKSLQMVIAIMKSKQKQKHLLLGRKVMTNLDSIFKSRDINYVANKVPSSQGYGFPSCHVWM